MLQDQATIFAPKPIGLQGFTLAELLIALLILGQIATFTIPKIINAQQNGQKKAAAKEIAAMISAAYQQYMLSNAITSNTGIGDLTPYMNYVALDSTSTIDDVPGFWGKPCGTPRLCLKMHNGALVLYETGENFSGTAATNVVSVIVDPDGSYSGSTTGSGKGMRFFLYTTGRITSWIGTSSTAQSNLTNYTGPFPNREPSWFNWD